MNETTRVCEVLWQGRFRNRNGTTEQPAPETALRYWEAIRSNVPVDIEMLNDAPEYNIGDIVAIRNGRDFTVINGMEELIVYSMIAAALRDNMNPYVMHDNARVIYDIAHIEIPRGNDTPRIIMGDARADLEYLNELHGWILPENPQSALRQLRGKAVACNRKEAVITFWYLMGKVVANVHYLPSEAP